MTAQKIVCNRCKNEAYSAAYSISHYIERGTLYMDMQAGTIPAYEEHYCGKECLMKALNEIVEGLTC